MTCDAAGTAAALRAIAATMKEHRAELTELDIQIGDGDHGENLARGFAALLVKLDAGEGQDSPADVLRLAGTTLISTVGGAAGVLFGAGFLRAAAALDGVGRPDAAPLDGVAAAQALAAAVDGVVGRGKAAPGDKTMVDALHPASLAATAAADAGQDLPAVLAAAATAAAEGARSTTPMQAHKGRASYLGERSIGHQDPGATSTAYLLAALASAALG